MSGVLLNPLPFDQPERLELTDDIPALRVRPMLGRRILVDGRARLERGPGTAPRAHALVVAQIALALALLISSGLMIRTSGDAQRASGI